MYTIGELAGLAGISGRTLRHYDQIGLLRPEQHTHSGYRMYTSEDAVRLQQILLFRELEFPLAEIASLMLDPAFDRRGALEQQAELLEKRAGRLAALAKSARRTLADQVQADQKGERKMEDKELFQAFDYDRMMEEQKTWEPEVERRWGNTEAYRVSRERTKRMAREDWSLIKARQAEDLNALATLYRAEAAPDDPRVQDLVSRARGLIDETFYPCSWKMFRGLGQMYEADPRFASYYDREADGLSGFYSKAIKIRCDAEDAAQKRLR